MNAINAASDLSTIIDNATPAQRHRAHVWVSENVSLTTDHAAERAFGRRLIEIVFEDAGVPITFYF